MYSHFCFEMIDAGLLKHLSGFITPDRMQLFETVLNKRTRYLTVVLEDIYQSQNASAVLRTCDCFGIQDVHIIENSNDYNLNPDVVHGADKWLTLHKYNQTSDNSLRTLKELKDKGYRLIATTPHTNDTLLNDFDPGQGKTALIFGTEQTGISETIQKHADGFLQIPMFGFTESFNISVSAAICLQNLVSKLHASEVIWKLSKQEKDAILFNWLKTTVKRSDLIIQRYCAEKGLNLPET